MAKRLKPFIRTSRGGRRQVSIKHPLVRSICEQVSRSSGYPLQKCFDELLEMMVEGHVVGVNTQDKMYERIVGRLAQ